MLVAQVPTDEELDAVERGSTKEFCMLAALVLFDSGFVDDVVVVECDDVVRLRKMLRRRGMLDVIYDEVDVPRGTCPYLINDDTYEDMADAVEEFLYGGKGTRVQFEAFSSTQCWSFFDAAIMKVAARVPLGAEIELKPTTLSASDRRLLVAALLGLTP